MSGYLQRLVHGITHPHESVHPRAGSIYMPEGIQRDFPLQESDEVETAAPATRSQPASDHPADREERHEQPLSVHTPLLPKVATPGVFQDPVPSPARESPRMSSKRSPGRSGQRALEMMDEPHADGEVDPADVAGPNRARATDEQVAPTLAAQSYRPLIKPARASEVHTTAPVARHAQAQSRPPVLKPEPDEIQVHIGRIEVTAVHAPTPQAPKAPDKSISLDAYLNRRNGRVR